MKLSLLLIPLHLSIFPAAYGSEQTPLPESYIHFEQMTEALVAPLVPLLKEGKSSIPIIGRASDHGLIADELESVARPGLLLALWLQMEELEIADRSNSFTREEVAGWYKEALLMGTDPQHEEYWGDLLNYHQNGVEMAIMTISLTVAREWIWDALDKEERDQIAAWFGQMRGTARYWNNHLYFAILVIEFLREEGYGQPGDAEAVGFMFELLESMHMGNGWFKDGINETYDHYNAYAFHTYGMWWSLMYGHTDPSRAARWKGWSHSFVQDYAHLYAASGENLPYGRSITYRFNGLGVFGLAAKLNLGALPMGEMRRICRKNLEFFMEQPIQQEQGCLSLGWTDEFLEMVEPYSCAGSPYWAAKGLMMLTLPPDHSFWHEEELPYPAERGNFTRVIPAPRFVFRGVNGEVELLNAGSQVSRGNARRYGPWKWSKLAYRTGRGFLVSDSLTRYPTDAALTVVRKSTGDRSGRHPTIPLEATDDHLSYLYALGTRDDGLNVPVRTDVFWKGEWLLAIHRVKSVEAVRYLHGSFSLGFSSQDQAGTTSENGYALASNGTHYSAIQSIKGFSSTRFDGRKEGDLRQHLTHPYHVTPVVQSKWTEGEQVLAVLLWTGMNPAEGTPWEVRTGNEGEWHFAHPILGDWKISHPQLPGF